MKTEALKQEMGEFLNIMQERLQMNMINKKGNKDDQSQVPGKVKVKLSGKIKCSTVVELRNFTQFMEEYDM
jgi:hypothetical protein